jgi:hypothetical protein
VWVLHYLAQHKLHMRNVDGALALAERALALAPEVPELLVQRGKVLRKAGDPQGAAWCAEEARKLDLADRWGQGQGVGEGAGLRGVHAGCVACTSCLNSNCPLVTFAKHLSASCPDALPWCTALVHCPGALPWCTALVHCPGALPWCTAQHRPATCHGPRLAVYHCSGHGAAALGKAPASAV